MSRAFVKEPDGSEVPDDLPERPQSPHPNHVTPAGLARLRAERAALLQRKVELAEAQGDLARQQELKHVERDLRYVEGRIERAIPIDPAGQPADEVAFGAVVEVRDEMGAPLRFAIVGEDEADATQGKVSWVSPLAKALLGARVGDSVTWHRPAGDRELEVVSIRYSADER